MIPGIPSSPSTSPRPSPSTEQASSDIPSTSRYSASETGTTSRTQLPHASLSAPANIGEIHSSLTTNLALPLGAASNISGNDALPILETSSRGMDTILADFRATLTAAENDLCDQIERFNAEFPNNRISMIRPRHPRPSPIETLLEEHNAAQAEDMGRELSPCERCCMTLDLLSDAIYKITRNDFNHPLGRWAANIANVSIRTGLIVAMLTTARQLIGFGIEKASLLGDSPFLNSEALGAASMCIGPALNLAGCIRDEINQTATIETRTARATMAALSIGALMTATVIQTQSDGSVLKNAIRSAGPQFATFTLARDLAYAFFPMKSNAPVNFKGSAISAFIYGSSQFAVMEAMEHFAPQSGPEFARELAETARASIEGQTTTSISTDRDLLQAFEWVRSTPEDISSTLHATSSSFSASTSTEKDDIAKRIHDAISNISPIPRVDIIRGLLNIFPEVSDELLLPALSRHFGVQETIDQTRNQAQALGINPYDAVAHLPPSSTEGLRISIDARIPTQTELADQFLTTSAMRTSAFVSIMGGALAVATALGQTLLSREDQGRITNAVVAALSTVLYIPMVHAHAQRPPGTSDAPPRGVSEIAVDSASRASEIGLRRRLLSSTLDSVSATLSEIEEHQNNM